MTQARIHSIPGSPPAPLLPPPLPALQPLTLASSSVSLPHCPPDPRRENASLSPGTMAVSSKLLSSYQQFQPAKLGPCSKPPTRPGADVGPDCLVTRLLGLTADNMLEERCPGGALHSLSWENAETSQPLSPAGLLLPSLG